MKYIKVTEKRNAPLPTDQVVGDEIGGARWNNQAVIEEQLQIIARNERIIARAGILLLLEFVAAALLGLAMYAMAT